MAVIPHSHTSAIPINSSEAWIPFKCGHCDKEGSGAVVAKFSESGYISKLIICTACNTGTVFTKGVYIPSSPFGPNIGGLPSKISSAYNEVRNCMSVNAFTASELICRKILMHVAVEKGAKEKDTFENYISFLEKIGFVTPPMKGWVGLIRKHGGQATHLLDDSSQERSESTVMFTAELLRLIYEMEHISKKYTEKKGD